MKIDIIGKYLIELFTGPIENPGYRVYELTYHAHRNHKPVKTKQQRPRFKLIETFETEAEAFIKGISK